MNLIRYVTQLFAFSAVAKPAMAARRLAPLTPEPALRAMLDPHRGTLVQPIMRPRVPGSQGSRAVQNFLISELSTAGFEAISDTFLADTPEGSKKMTNIVATRQGRGFGSAKLTLAAHYDSKMSPEGFIGAIDSALPCALLLFVAHVTSRPGAKTADVDFIFFDGEEAFAEWSDKDSLYGARHAVENLPLPNTLVLFDLIGHKSTPIPSWMPETHDLFAELEQLNLELMNSNKVSQRLLGGDARAYAGAMLDDHIPFMKRGVPCLHLIPHQFPPQWHSIDDNADFLDWNTIRDWALLLEAWLAKGGCRETLRFSAENEEPTHNEL